MSISKTPTKTLTILSYFPPTRMANSSGGTRWPHLLEIQYAKTNRWYKGWGFFWEDRADPFAGLAGLVLSRKAKTWMGREAGSGEGSRKQVGSSSLPFTGVGWEVLDLGMWLFLCTLPSQVPDLCVSDLNLSFSSSHQNVWHPSEHLQIEILH